MIRSGLLAIFALIIWLAPALTFAQQTKTTHKTKVKSGATKTVHKSAANKPKPDAVTPPLTAPDKMPQFPGGPEAIERYFVNALAGTPLLSSAGIILNVVVDQTGKVTQAEVKQGYRRYENGLWLEYPEIDRELLKAAANMPKWEPGLHQEKPVSVQQDLHFILMTPEQAKDKFDKVFVSVGQQPEFPGGEAKLMEYIGANLKYPEDMKQNQIEGMVVVQFVVSRFGEVKDPVILKGLSESINEETKRMILAMPQWKPGKQNGVAVNVRYTLPVRFKL